MAAHGLRRVVGAAQASSHRSLLLPIERARLRASESRGRERAAVVVPSGGRRSHGPLRQGAASKRQRGD